MADVLSVFDVAAEGDRGLACTDALVVADCVTRDGGPIHAIGSFIDGVITSAAMDAGEICYWRRGIDACRAEVAGGDQLSGGWPEH
jgi:hypothetical protein